jgi:hypothetical protein
MTIKFDNSSNPAFLGIVIAAVLVIAVVAGYSYYSGGLPGTKNSPSATVHGKSTVGGTAAD